MSNKAEHPEGGRELAVSIDGQLYIHPRNKKYLESISEKVKNPVPQGLKQIEKSTTSASHAGFSKGKVISDCSNHREEQLTRLTLMKNQRARLLKDLERVNSVIKSIETDLSI